MRSLSLFSLLFLLLIAFSSASSIYWVQDAYNHTDTGFQADKLGNLVVKICGSSTGIQSENQTASNFTIWVNNVISFNLSDANQVGRYTVCGSSNFTNTSVLSNLTSSTCIGVQPDRSLGVQDYYQCADFITNFSYTSTFAPGVNVNITSNKTALGGLAAFTYNFKVNAVRFTGAANMIFMRYNLTNVTPLDSGPGALGSDGVFAMHQLNSTGCLYHGIRPLVGSGGMGGPMESIKTGFGCYPLATGAETDDWLMHFDFTTSNGSVTIRRNQSNIALNPPSQLALTNIRLDSFCFGGFQDAGSCLNFSGFNATIINETNGLVYNGSVQVPQGNGGGSPAFLLPYKQYTVNVTGNLNGSYYTNQFPYLTQSPGMNGIILNVFKSDTYTTFSGQVFNSTGQPLQNAIVMVRKNNGFTPPDGVDFIAANLTNTNGVYSVRIAKSQNQGPGGFAGDNEDTYKIMVMSNATNNAGNLKYFPTENDNNGRGFRAAGDSIFLTPTTIMDASIITINVTLNNASNIMIETGLYSSGVLKNKRLASSKKMAPIKLFSNLDVPNNTYISMLVPAGNVIFNLFGMPSKEGGAQGPALQQASSLCFFKKTITAGVPTIQDCNLTAPSTINFTIGRCGSNGFGPNSFQSIFNCTSTTNDQGILWSNQFLIFNETNGDLLSSVEEGSFQREQNFQLEGAQGGAASNQVIKLLVPGGANYSVKVMPKFDWSPSLQIQSQRITTTFNATTIFGINTSMSWELQATLNSTLNASANNTIVAAVFDHALVTPGQPPSCGGGPCIPRDLLNNSHVTVYIYLLQLNGAYAGNMTSPITMTFQSTGLNAPGVPGAGFNTSFRPKDFNMSAGKFKLVIVALNQSALSGSPLGRNNFSVSKEFPITVSDFNLALTPAKNAFASTDAIAGKIYAVYPNGTKIDGTVNLQLSDEANAVLNTSSVTMTAGVASFSLLQNAQLPAGTYELVASMNASNSFGFSTSFIQVADFLVDAKFDKSSYASTENATLVATVKLANGTAVANASVEISVDGSQSSNLNFTAANGKATFTLDPSKMAQNSNWAPGFRMVDVKISAQSGNKVSKQRIVTGFDVKGVEIDMHTERFSYTKDENVTLLVFSSSQPTLYIDGSKVSDSNATSMSNGYKFLLTPPSGGWSSGFHNLQAEVTSGTNKQSLFRGFEVNVLNINSFPLSFSNPINQNATIMVRVMNTTSGSPIPVDTATVTYVFNKFEGLAPIQLGTYVNTTNANGEATGQFNITSAGFNFVEITVQKGAVTQKQFVGFFASGITVRATTDKQTYAPGDTVMISVNVSDSAYVAQNGATVEGQIRSFGDSVNLGTNSTNAGGLTNLTYVIPTSASTQTRFAELRISTATGDTAFAGVEIRIAGFNLLVRPSRPSYEIGQNVTMLADLRNATNGPIADQSITFELLRPGKVPLALGSATTDSKGSATVTFNSSTMNITSDGFYAVRVYSTGSDGLQTVVGFSMSSLKVGLTLNSSRITLGQTVQFNITISNSSGSVTPTNLELEIWNEQKGKFNLPVTITGNQPYQLNLTVPNEPNALGSYSVGAVAYSGVSRGDARAMMFVQNDTATLTMTIDQALTAQTPFIVTLNATDAGTGQVTLTTFSPGADTVANTTTVTLVGGYKNVTLNLTNPGQYVLIAESSVYGTISTGRFLAPVGGTALFYAQNSTANNATLFTAGSVATFYTTAVNSTVSIVYNSSGVMVENEVPLVLDSNGYYNGNYTLTSAGFYMARLDTNVGSGLAALLLKAT